MPDNLSDMHLAISAAEAVGMNVIMPLFLSQELGVEVKADNSPVTLADTRSETYLRESLTAVRPSYGWLSEEAENDPERLSCKRVWVIDPVDGTKSFIRKSDEFAVSIGIVEQDHSGTYHPVVGVVHMPAQNRTISAARGHGVFMDGEAVQRQSESSWDTSVVTYAHGEENVSEVNAIFGANVMQRRVVASIALRLAELGAGQSDLGVTTHKICEWDIAAGNAICCEAGLVVADLNGDLITYNKPDPTVEGVTVAPEQHHAMVVELCSLAGFSGSARGTRAWAD